MASPFAIGSAIGGVAFMLLSIAPIPASRFALLRTVVAGVSGGMFAAGYFAAKADEKREREIAAELAKIKEEEDFEREQARKDKLAIAESQREVLVVEAKQKETARIQVAIADYTDDVRDAYVAVQDGKGRLDRCLLNQHEQNADEEQKLEAESTNSIIEIVEDIKHTKESFAAKKAKLLKFLKEYEGGWILKILKKPLLIYGGQGSGKSYFAEFVALCRYYLRDHEIVSISDPHFHQNKDECWQHLVRLGVKGFGAHHNYQEVNDQLEAMYDSFAIRTLKSPPQTRIFDEVTRYKEEEATRASAAKLGSKLSSDVRKANCCPIVIAHGDTLTILGGADGFAQAINENFVKLKLNSNDEQEPLWRGTISGIKDEDGEMIVNMKISITAPWIRSSWVYNLFNSDDEIEPIEPIDSKVTPEPAPFDSGASFDSGLDAAKFDRMMKADARWQAESTPEILEQLKQEWLAGLGDRADNSVDNLADNPPDKGDKLVDDLSRSDKPIYQEIIAKPLYGEDYPLVWSEEDFARILPSHSETGLFERILDYLDKSRNASEIIQKGLGFSKPLGHKRSYSQVGKPCFKYLVRKYGSAAMIAEFQAYLDKD